MSSKRNNARFRERKAKSMDTAEFVSSDGLQGSSAQATDAFANAAARMGWGTNSLAEGTEYPLVRLSLNYMLLVSLYRNHWLARRIVDGPAQDMLRSWPKLTCKLKPNDIKAFERTIDRTGTQTKALTALKWGRLFGGAGALIIIKGHEKYLNEPLDLNDVNPGSYRGLIPFDRWSGITPGSEISEDLDYPLNFGLPETYTVRTEADTFEVHHSRILRFAGLEVPSPEFQAQSRWGISVLEVVYEELRKRDNASWSILQLLFRAQILAQKNPELAQMLSGATASAQNMARFLSTMQTQNELLSNQSMMILGKEGGLETHQFSFTGLAEVLQQFQMDISGAAEYTVTRLFGRTLTGLGQTNDGDERIYEEKTAQKQHDEVKPQLDKLFPVICMSEFGEVPDDLDYAFPSVRVLTEEEKANLAKDGSAAVVEVSNSGLVTPRMALRELQQQSQTTGIWTNITEEDVQRASDEFQIPGEMKLDEKGLPEDGEGSAADAAAMDAEWNESDHPRAENGEFGSGGGGGSASVGLKSHESRESWPEHIKVLKIPPAWKDVRVSDNPDADLLAIGKDTKGRPQYVYSQKFQQSQAALKFARIKSLESDAPMIKDQLSTLTKSNDRKVADHADCANLIFKMGIRPGSDSDTKAKVKAYGATTLEGKHVVTEGDETYLRFTGKKGVAINLHVDDPELASNLRKRAGDAGENGRLFGGVRGGSLLDFVHGELDHGGYKTKDFRTLLANNQASDVIARMPAPKSEKEYKKAVLEVAKQVSAKLGNTPTVALQSYINPAVFGAWRESYAVA